MSRFFGTLGLTHTYEQRKGLYVAALKEIQISGDLIRNKTNYGGGNAINENITFSSQLSFVADPFVLENLGNIKYVSMHGTKWKVTSIDDVTYPRITVSLGGVYNEEQ